MSNYITESSEWTLDNLQKINKIIWRIAKEKYHLDTFPNQVEIITSEQMIDNYSSVGLPLYYQHWSIGKAAEKVRRAYEYGRTNLAYELVINSNPCIAYLMEENSTAMQALVIAHACYGHNSFFKGNYLFRQWTSPESIVDYMVFARNYIAECEEKYGWQNVEYLLDSCHALSNYGVDRYKHPQKLSLEKEKARQKERAEYLQSQVDELWEKTIPKWGRSKNGEKEAARFPEEPQENVLYFIEKNAPFLEPWQREIVRIVRKIAQYFYPQRQTKVMNEGWATFWHYTLMNDFYDEGFINDGFMEEFFVSHTNVILQPSYDKPYYTGINPYALGFATWRDIRRICENPTEEDRRWFPEMAGSNWLATMDFAMRNFKDESFIGQYLSPKVIRDMKIFTILDDLDVDKEYLIIDAIHNEEGYREVRDTLAKQYDIGTMEPDIQVWSVNTRGDRAITLRHTEHDKKPLEKKMAEKVMKHLFQLWGPAPVRLEALKADGKVEIIGECGFPKLPGKK